MTTKKAAAKAKVEEESSGRFEVDGEVLEFDLDEITFGEGEELETYFDRPLNEIDFASTRGVMFIAFLAKRRADPKVTLDDIRELSISSLKEAPSSRPTEEVSETNGSPSSPTS